MKPKPEPEPAPTKRTRQRKTVKVPFPLASGKKMAFSGVVAIGVIMIMLIIVTAYAANIRYDINSMIKENNALDYPTLEGWRHAQQQAVTRWNEQDLEVEPAETGLQASPTHVVSTEIPQSQKVIEWLNDGNAARQLINSLIHA